MAIQDIKYTPHAWKTSIQPCAGVKIPTEISPISRSAWEIKVIFSKGIKIIKQNSQFRDDILSMSDPYFHINFVFF